MLAVVITQPGGPEVLTLRNVPDPTFGPDDVLVGVRATAVNRADLLQRRGRYPAPPGAPADIPGLEVAGEVLAHGESVTAVRRGDRVMAIVGGGGYAERSVVPSGCCLRIPEGMSWEEAAAIPEAFLTAYDALKARARLASGETVLVTAAASGVGTAAIQLALVLGACPVALSRSKDKRERLSSMGAPAVFDPEEADLPRLIREASGGRGVNVVVDLVGATAWKLYWDVLAEAGRIVVVGTLSGARVDFDLSTLMRRRATVVGTVLRARSRAEKAALSAAFASEMLELFERGALRPVIDQVLPLADVVEAHRLVEANRTFGKVVLRI